jgi:hypothetical protein
MDDVFTPADAMRADYFYEFHEVGNTDPLTPLAQVTKRVPIVLENSIDQRTDKLMS